MSEGITEAIQKALDVALKSFGVANSITVALENICAATLLWSAGPGCAARLQGLTR